MRVAVVGSGPTGVAAATALADHGIAVDLLDGGYKARSPDETMPAEAPRQGPTSRVATALDLAFRKLPAGMLRKPIHGSDFAFAGTDGAIPLAGGWLPRSLAIGGLANVWGAACYPFRSVDYREWPVGEGDMAPWYRRAGVMMGVNAEADGLAAAYPLHGEPTCPTSLPAHDEGSAVEALLERWRRHARPLAEQGLACGRSRLAVVPPDASDRACIRCGACHRGCPTGAIWNAAPQLTALAAHDGFRHRPGAFVRRVIPGDDLHLAVGWPGAPEELLGPYDSVFLAAGALSSFRIAAQSVGTRTTNAQLLDNHMFLVPMRLTTPVGAQTHLFTLSEAAIAFDPGTAAHHSAHLQLYRPSDAMLGPLAPLLHGAPRALRDWARRRLDRWLIGFLYFHSDDSRRLEIGLAGDGDVAQLKIVEGAGAAGARAAAGRALAALGRAKAGLGLSPLKIGVKEGEPGLSGHLGGTLPMRSAPGLLECDSAGRLRGLSGVYVVDASAFPAMPAQNPTLTAVANALRVANDHAIERSSRTAA